MAKKEAFLQFLKAARSLQDRGLSKEAIVQFAKNEFGELSELFKKQIDSLFKPKKGIENIKIKDEVFDDTVIKLPVDDTGKPFNPRDPLKDYSKKPKDEDPGFYTGGMVDVEPNLSDIGHGSDALMARTRLVSPDGQATTSTGLNYLLAEDNDNIRVPFKEKGKVSLLDLIKVNASGSKSGRQQIQGAPKGITVDKETINAIVNLDIPINEKMNIIGSYAYGKGRNKIEDKEQEIFLDEGGYKDRNIGLGFNQDGEGLSGSIMRNLETGDDSFKIKFLKRFAEGGRIGFADGNGVADEDAEKAALGKRVRELMDEGFDIGEAVKQAMSEGYAEGGRIGFSKGKIAKEVADKGRRGFMKAAGAVGAGIAALKTGLLGFGKGATKQVAEELTSVPIGNPEGMPAWFKPLVNKIIKEGDDVTKKFGTVDREIVHTKKIDDFEEVTVYQDLNTGNVRMEYGPHLTDDTGKVIRASNEPTVVQLEYKAPEMIEPNITTGKGGGKTKEEFYAAESEPEIVNWDGDIEMSGINEVNKVDDLITDTSKLQKYATNNKLTIKELSDSMKKQKYKNKLDSDLGEQVNYIENKSGMNAMDYIDEGTRVGDFDPKGYRNYDTKGINLPEKKASGGIARMIGE